MKRWLSANGRRLALGAVVLLLAGLLVFVALRAGPLARVQVTVATVEAQALTPALYGIGTVEARYSHRIGPTFAGRVRSVAVQPGERVHAGQVMGEMDPVDLDERLAAQEAARRRAEANVLSAEAQIREAEARQRFAAAQAQRYARLLETHSVSAEAAAAKQQDAQATAAALQAARAGLDAARQEFIRLRAEHDALRLQRANLRLVAPVDGLVTRRDADPGTTVVAGQVVVEIVEPASVWISARFDQQRATGLQAALPAQIVLRSAAGSALAGRVARIEPLADAVTEEVLAKIDFAALPARLPPLGELAEVTVALPALPARPVLATASVHRVGGRLGAWVVEDGGALRFAPLRLGAADLDGRVQVLDGLQGGERVVVYSQKVLAAGSRIEVVDRLVGAAS
ncbi:efflux RND transporter periplasmic adaptor subunit [Thauera aromatica]|uniref:efflux RND transporter periplasmic adaptor subunit n=1 Tax=Thauera aromatica TaxID=59405 RepID=UPI001FFD5745|nr:efflux RND transporter periplasmic adaptor subunit [Thauera aromatica]MCK2087060.1 efflux RND transporter periplasmic adaptor subunit [Thauera aromatica]MCK2126962.1 efflux RND transporter periplasmic adaptor subunit [Thauera aromatica]